MNQVTTSPDTGLINKICAFINSIGIKCYEGTIPESTFLPGVEIVCGQLVYNSELLTYPGDLLHEAGHLAVLLPEHRLLANGSENMSGYLHEGGAEMAAIAWSWASREYLGLADEAVFHPGGYKNSSASIISSFRSTNIGTIMGVPLLQWMGMTRENKRGIDATEAVFPKMSRWLRQGQNLL